MTNTLFHVIKDPVHGTMQFTSTENAWVKPFIDSPHFQRLRHIKQLGMGDLIFPGAVHSRFNHSLGCCYVASQIAHKIGLVDEERQLVMIACLLHDIGHGPFSHAFEGIFNDKRIRHEDWTPYFLADYGKKEFSKHISEEKFQQIADMIMHRPTKRQVLADVVSSQLDADRLDYLLRDSHFCGVRYGEYDFRWMLHCMTIVDSDQGERLGITHKGIGVVEHYLMARRLMTRNIYQGQKKLALEEAMVWLLASLAESLESYQAFKKIRETPLGQFLLAVNQFNQSKGNKRDFLEEHFANYKSLCDYDVFALIKQLSEMNDAHPAISVAKQLQLRRMPKIVRIDEAHLENAAEALNAFKLKYKNIYQDWQLALIQTPHQSYSGEDDPILVVGEQGEIKPISDYSFMINAISDKLEHVAFLSIDRAITEDAPIVSLMRQL